MCGATVCSRNTTLHSFFPPWKWSFQEYCGSGPGILNNWCGKVTPTVNASDIIIHYTCNFSGSEKMDDNCGKMTQVPLYLTFLYNRSAFLFCATYYCIFCLLLQTGLEKIYVVMWKLIRGWIVKMCCSDVSSVPYCRVSMCSWLIGLIQLSKSMTPQTLESIFSVIMFVWFQELLKL